IPPGPRAPPPPQALPPSVPSLEGPAPSHFPFFGQIPWGPKPWSCCGRLRRGRPRGRIPHQPEPSDPPGPPDPLVSCGGKEGGAPCDPGPLGRGEGEVGARPEGQIPGSASRSPAPPQDPGLLALPGPHLLLAVVPAPRGPAAGALVRGLLLPLPGSVHGECSPRRWGGGGGGGPPSEALTRPLLQLLQVSYSALTMFLTRDQQERDSATAYRMTAEMAGTLIGATAHGLIVAGAHEAPTCPEANLTAPPPTLGSDIPPHTSQLYMIAAGVIAGTYPLCAALLALGTSEEDDLGGLQRQGLSFLQGLGHTLRHQPYQRLVAAFLFISAAVQVPPGPAPPPTLPALRAPRWPERGEGRGGGGVGPKAGTSPPLPKASPGQGG
uniref:Uncharacterized protein n=1 Tax=Sarcophilus harrisii TaxID=9305 RepID=A0A7N4NW56_SARHA